MPELGRRLAPCALLATLSFATFAEAGGKLERVRDVTSSRDDEDDDDDGNEDEDEDDDDCDGLGVIFCALFNGDEEEDRPTSPALTTYFAPYPYADGYGGNLFVRRPAPRARMVPIACPIDDPYCLGDGEAQRPVTCAGGHCYVEDGGVPEPEIPPGTQQSRLRLDAALGSDVDGLFRHSYGFWFESAALFGLEAQFTHWIEPLGDGRTDELVLGDGNVLIRVLELSRVQAQLGVGFRVLFDGANEESQGGFNGTLAVESYPAAPFTLRGVIDAGNLGPAFVLEGQAFAGVMLGRFELFAGYTGMSIGPVRFHGPLAGVRLHL